ncbi:MAG: hypothetical protein HKN46_04205, partial [Acidimicrobiia bacterium]|nr:hypothetical protein [Acidimicrobiia bacterium]
MSARALALLALVPVTACGGGESRSDAAEASGDMTASADSDAVPSIQATNAFYYYVDVEAAQDFYSRVMGFETVVDYGFAKIMRVAPASYVTLVDEAEGMHSAEEPKSVTLAIVTEQVEGWYDYLVSQGVEMRGEYNYREGQPHDGFVAIDPEGYYLEVERFNPHEENTLLMPLLDGIEPLGPVGETSRPTELMVQATVLWLYYEDVPAIEDFWEELLGVDLMVDQGWAKVYQASATGFIGPVDGSRGLHTATEDKAVTVSFFTDDVASWLDRARALELEL